MKIIFTEIIKNIFYNIVALLLLKTNYFSYAILFGQQNEIRLLESLDGLWTFVREPANSEGIGIINNWAEMDLSFEFENATKIPVPAAYNDLSFERDLQNHVGWVWYQRLYWLPSTLINNQNNRPRSFLHFGSVQYFAIVYLNGKEIGRHVGGHLPFQFELELIQNFPNLITVAVNNTLSSYTIPPGEFNIINLSSGNKIIQQTPNFDFFNYAGILRPVQIWHLPKIFINDIKLIADCYGNLSYSIEINEELQILPKIIVTIFYGNKIVALMEGLNNNTKIEKVNLWWPRGMGKPNLYIAEVKLFSENNGILLDVYRETFGFRSVSIEDGLILINKKHFYCFGFGMHEDFEVHGRGFDRSVMIKDLNIFEWLNANCYRTSHYPYSEERAYEADRRGIVVITEVPAVGLRNFDKSLAKLHARMITEMINRDKNHPSIIAWSLANEPLIKGDASFEYFSDLTILTRHLDPTRPITAVFGYLSYRKIFNLFDIICLNRYYGWYHGLGLIDAIKDSLLKELNDFRSQFPSKPIYMTEYGAEAIPGLHEMPSAPFTEQYQVEIIQKTTQVFEELRLAGHLSGEMLWNFADFMTAPSTSRVVGNHKGVLTRDRKPKMAAHFIKRRYGYLLNEQKRLFLKNEL